MNDHELDGVLGEVYRARTARLIDRPTLHEHVLQVTTAAGERSSWLSWLPEWTVRSLLGTTRFAVAVMVVVLFGGFLLVAQPYDQVADTEPAAETDRLPPVTGPAGNGLIAFDRDGDIYVGDPVTGSSHVIVDGPEIEMRPRFSPDGTRIAFRRLHAPDEAIDKDAMPDADADWVVVRTDGSDERILARTDGPFGRGQGDFVWSPDGHSLVVTQATHGGPQFSHYLIYATGSGVAVPMGPAGLGAYGSFGGAQVAWFLRPPFGDRLLVSDCCDDPDAHPLLAETDRDGSDKLDLGARSGLARMGYPRLLGAEWSPDASRILVTTEHTHGTDPLESNLYVMDADGSDLRRLEPRRLGEGADFPSPQWSPDGTMIAYEWGMAVEPSSPDGCMAATWIAIMDVEGGAVRDLEASRFPADGDCPGIADWTWSPDGRSILMAPGEPGIPPLVIDIETDTATELPWPSDSFPSWQRIAAD